MSRSSRSSTPTRCIAAPATATPRRVRRRESTTAVQPTRHAGSLPTSERARVERPIKGRVGTFTWRDHELAYEVRGAGDEPFVLIHGLLLPSWVNGDIATRLASQGNKVILLDLLGHGRSDKPTHASWHRLEYAGDQVVGLLDHLGIGHAVIGGMSLGANVSLETAARHPERVRALVCEMPVLERGTVNVMLTLAPLLAVLHYAERPLRPLFRLVSRLPRTSHEPLNAILDTGGDPRAMAAVLHGYTSGPVCPPADARRGITAPALVIGHRRDWIHPMNDAQALVRELPNATLANARHIFEMRSRPGRLVGEIAGFLDEVWERSG